MMPPTPLPSFSAARTAPHEEWPRTTTSRVPSCSTPNSDARYLRGGGYISGHTDDEQIAEAPVEEDLDGHARVRASQDDGERRLARDQFAAARLNAERTPAHFRYEPVIPRPQALECL